MTSPLAAVQAYLDAFNSGDVEAMSAAFAESGSILDGMAPHAWIGPQAARDWYRDVVSESAHLGATDYHVTTDAPLHHSISGDAAYVVVPATMTFLLNGQPCTQTGAHFTVALHRASGEWRIVSWAWTKGGT